MCAEPSSGPFISNNFIDYSAKTVKIESANGTHLLKFEEGIKSKLMGLIKGKTDITIQNPDGTLRTVKVNTEDLNNISKFFNNTISPKTATQDLARVISDHQHEMDSIQRTTTLKQALVDIESSGVDVSRNNRPLRDAVSEVLFNTYRSGPAELQKTIDFIKTPAFYDNIVKMKTEQPVLYKEFVLAPTLERKIALLNSSSFIDTLQHNPLMQAGMIKQIKNAHDIEVFQAAIHHISSKSDYDTSVQHSAEFENISMPSAAHKGHDGLITFSDTAKTANETKSLVREIKDDPTLYDSDYTYVIDRLYQTLGDLATQQQDLIPTMNIPPHTEISHSQSFAPQLPEHSRQNKDLVTTAHQGDLESVQTYSSGYEHVENYAPGMKTKARQQVYENPSETADYSQRNVYRYGDTPVIVSCHLDGSGQAIEVTENARLFAHGFQTGVTNYINAHGINSSHDMTKAIMFGMAAAQELVCTAGYTQAATASVSLMIPSPTDNRWIHVSASVGDVDTIKIANNQPAQFINPGQRSNPLDIQYPGGQVGYNRTGTFVPDLTDLRIGTQVLQPGDVIGTVSDGITDNHSAMSRHSKPTLAIIELENAGRINREDFLELERFESFTELQDELKTMIDSYQQSQDPDTKQKIASLFDKFIRLNDLYQEYSISRCVEGNNVQNTVVNIVSGANNNAHVESNVKNIPIIAQDDKGGFRYARGNVPFSDDGRVCKHDDLSADFMVVPKHPQFAAESPKAEEAPLPQRKVRGKKVGSLVGHFEQMS